MPKKEVFFVETRPKHILLVEDQRVAALAQRAILVSLGYTVDIAVSGNEAMEKHRQQTYDLVLMDIELGVGIDGGETAKQLQEEREIPVVFLSAHTDAPTIERTRAAASYGYVVTGTGDALLHATLETALALFETRYRLRESEARYRLLIENTHDIIYSLSLEGTFTYVSPSWTRMLGQPPETIVGTSFRRYIHPEDVDACDVFFRKFHEGTSFLSGVEYRVLRQDGIWCWHTSSATAVRDGEGHLVSFIGIARDISERKVLEEALRHQATHDTLTGLPNRTLFLDRLEHELAMTRRRGRGGALIFLDLDNFKSINDTLGHAAGDRLLVAVAQRLKALVREADTVARMGGDEFTLLLPEAGDAPQVSEVALRICQALHEVFLLGEQELFVSASMGISLYPADGNSVTTLLKLADMAMYRAKASGRNTYRFWSGSEPTPPRP